jgi:hypothetical protein
MRNLVFGIGLAVGLMILFVGGVAGYMYADEQLNYDPVTARVEAVEPFCVMEYRRGRSSVWESEPMGCDEAARLDGRGDNNRRIERLRLTFRYTSPADQAERQGVIETLPNLYPNVAPGDEVIVLAHVRDPERTAERVF